MAAAAAVARYDPMLPDVLPAQFVQRATVDRGRQLRHRLGKAAVAQRHLAGVLRPGQIDVQRLLGKRLMQAVGQGRRPRGVEAPRHRIPGHAAAGDHDEQGLWPLVRQPVRDLLPHPGRGRGLGRGEQDEIARIVEPRAYGAPERRRRREAGLVAKHVHAAQAIPGLGKTVQCGLQGRCQAMVGGVTV